MRKMICCLFVLTLMASMILTVEASDVSAGIRIKLDVGELPVTDGAFTLYRVGLPISDGYRIEDRYGGGFVREEDALSPHLAQWLNAMEEKVGTTILLDVDGNAVYSELQPGLYLLVQTEPTEGFYPIQPFLVTVPETDRKQVSLYLEPLPRVAASPPTGQDPTPYIGAIGLVLSLAGMALMSRGKRRW